MEKPTRKAFTLKQKYEIIEKIQSGVKQSDICKDLKLQKSTVATIWKKRHDILSAYDKTNVRCKKLKTSAHQELDKGLLKWFTQKRYENVPLSGSVLQEKASEMGSKIKKTEFKCSRSWIERFKKRHNISSGKIVGESAGVDSNVVNDWLNNVWPTIRDKYEYKDIFNADETGLFYKMTPNTTLKFVGETCAGGKLSKSRITVLVVANMSGTEKRKLLVIGKSVNPRCFKNKVLPVKYKANSKAWMTSEIFKTELREWDEKLKVEKRKILLLIDNCPAHPDVELEQIKLIFMPPNTSSKLQPMDQGVIHSLKCHYRKILLMKMLDAIDKNKTFSVDLLDAIHFIHMAWEKVSRETIANCFKHGGFLRKEGEYDSDDDLPLNQWLQKHAQEPKYDHDYELDNNMHDLVEEQAKRKICDFDFNDYVAIDKDVVAREALTDEQIIDSVTSNMVSSDSDEDNDDLVEFNSVEDTHVYVPTIREMENKISDTRNFLESRQVPDQIWASFCNLESYINREYLSSRNVQTKITDFIK